jgi:hypothetical protein
MAYSTTRQLSAALRIALGFSMLSGCSVFSVNPTFELVKMGGAVALSAIATGPSSAKNSVHHSHPEIKAVCVEYNPTTPDAEIVPALQLELKAHEIESRIFEIDGAPPTCQFLVSYTAGIEWGIPPMAAGYRAYLREATLTLRNQEGVVLSSSAYELDDKLGMGKWATARSKLAPLVTQLVTGFDH